MNYEILQGHALAVLKTMPSESVQCSITSPPYYGLRSYKTEPQIWDGDEFCQHVWGEHYTPPNGGKSHPDRPSTVGANRSMNDMPIRGTGYTTHFCQLCQAWRGELGLEPTFQLYISHLVQIFAEVKRVLKSDGVCFVNLGDSFNGAKIGNTVHTSTSTLHANSEEYISNLQSMKIDKKLQKGLRPKSLMNIPHRFFIAMTENPYTLRKDLTDEQRIKVINELVKRGII